MIYIQTPSPPDKTERVNSLASQSYNIIVRFSLMYNVQPPPQIIIRDVHSAITIKPSVCFPSKLTSFHHSIQHRTRKESRIPTILAMPVRDNPAHHIHPNHIHQFKRSVWMSGALTHSDIDILDPCVTPLHHSDSLHEVRHHECVENGATDRCLTDTGGVVAHGVHGVL